ncbi:MAG: flagellar hook-length control protein FliK [Rhodospirillales bacterium]|nr:flagellar hook-length control protein FliK [Rhodospirillales bacterium]
MDLSFFLSPQTQSSPQGKVLSGLLQEKMSQGQNLGDLFTKMLQGQFQIQQDMAVPKGTDDGDLDRLMAQISQTLSLMLQENGAFSTEDGNVVLLKDFMPDLPSQLQVSMKDGTLGQIALPDDVKLALLNLLGGTPVSLMGLSGQTASMQASPFANTEATQDEMALFNRILMNVKQGLLQDIPQAAIIAAGLAPQQMEGIASQNGINLSEPESLPELSDDLIALLGLMQNLPQQSFLSRMGLAATLGDGGAWSLENGFSFLSDGSQDPAQLFTNAQIKAALAATQAQAGIGGAASKAGLMMAGIANENMSADNAAKFSFSGLMMTGSPEGGDWVDPITQDWINTPVLPSAMTGGNLVSVVTQAVSAQTPHPATQLVAASLQKNAGAGDARNWTLQLDPPELGRIEVRLNFTKDKLVKAQMIIEKPETWLMLQRDAQVLERALQDAGFGAGQDGLSFELAEHGFDFSGNGTGSGGTGQEHNASGSQNAAELIETTMTWFVDPDTGLERYNLMV